MTQPISFLTKMQLQMMFPHQFVRRPLTSPADAYEGLEAWEVQTDAGATEGWFFKGVGASVEKPAPAIVFAHGNGELIDDWPQALEPFLAMGVSVLIPEYRGYGRSSGTPSIAGIQQDYVAFYDRLVSLDIVDASRIVFVGRSIGGGVACALAEERTPAAFILMSVFSDIQSLAKRMGVPKLLVNNVYDNKRIIAELGLPTLIIHGQTDKLIPVQHAHELETAATGPVQKVLYPSAHNDTPSDWNDFFEHVSAFFKRHGIVVP